MRAAFEDALIVNGFPLLEFDRAPIDRHVLRGFALNWNTRLTLIQVMEDIQFRLNGHAIFRNSDVKTWRRIAPDEFTARAAKLNKLRPSKPIGVSLTSMKDALSSAGARFPLLTIHRERIERRVCYVGRLQEVSQRTAKMRQISPHAEWEQEERYGLKDITLLEFGGAYEGLLARLAGPI